MARFLLDTQAFLHLYENGLEGLSSRVREALANLENEFLLSTISVTEIAVKVGIKKLVFPKTDLGTPEEEVSRAAEELRITVIPYTLAHANKLFDLPLHHRDPFDRMLIATALGEGVPVISGDAEFNQYNGLQVIW